MGFAPMSTPLPLSDEEIDLLHRLAAPIAFGQRQAFLDQVASALASSPGLGPGGFGPGLVHRVAREVQRSFTLSAQRETETGDGPRHLKARAAIRI